MNKLMISIAVASALGLVGCSGEKLEDVKQESAQAAVAVTPAARVVFDPSNSRVSVPNDLLFQGTTDGTLVMPGEQVAAPNYANPQTAIGALDGWSPQNPFTIELQFPAGISLNAASASLPTSVRIVEMLMGDPASPDTNCRAVPRGAACKAVASLTFGVDYVTRAVGNNVAVIPLKPLKPATTYMLVLTDSLKDSLGKPVQASTTYELVKQDVATKPLGTEAQLGLQRVINSFENAVSTQNIPKASIIYTAAFTTQSTVDVYATVKQLMLPSPLNGNRLPLLTAADTGLRVSDAIGQPAFQVAKLYAGSVKLPYYLSDPSQANPTAFLNTAWKARCDSGAMIAALSQAQKDGLAAAITDPVQKANDEFCNAASGGKLRDFGIDKQRHLTKFNTIPMPTITKDVPVQITVPDEALIGKTKPAEGWPVVMLQHGIGSCKENMLAVTAALSAAGFATVAIDHPLHGSRGYDLDGKPGREVTASQQPSCDTTKNNVVGSATVYMNLQNLLVTRDNLRQSVTDMMGLRLSLHTLAATQPGLLNAGNVQFLGHSLGGITGTTMVGLINSPTGNATADALYKVNSAVQAMPGGAIANFLLESEKFKGTVKGSILLGSDTLKAGFTAYVVEKQGCIAPDKVPAAAFAACAFQHTENYLKSLADTGQTATIAAINATFSQFAFAAQTVTDAGDPNNFANLVVATKTPSLVFEVVGGATEAAKPDDVIPNRVAAMPLAGTSPLAALLKAVQVPATKGMVDVNGAAISRFNVGDHGSILNPQFSLEATTEMQQQAASFFATQGTKVVVNNPTVLK